jgi:hypothetical protein
MKVLISPGYGAGWSTWEGADLATDPRLIKAFERGISALEMQELCADLGYGDVYMGGFKNLTIVEVPKGTIFRIKEYDGFESIEVFDDSDWLRA